VAPERRGHRGGSIGLIRIGTPLTRERENELHREIADGRAAATELATRPPGKGKAPTELRRRVARGRRAEEELLAGTGALVKRRVNDLGFAFDQDELEGAALEGLVRALRTFDPDRRVRFATYANYWITKLVYGAITHRVHFPESDVRLVIKLRRLKNQRPGRPFTVTEVAKQLKVSRTRASEIVTIDDAMRSGATGSDAAQWTAAATEPWPEAQWVIDRLKALLGADFEDFWMWTGRVMSLEELGRRNGITKQAMAKRVQKWRRTVEGSVDAQEMLTWLRAQ
jgi:hypothetical protein